MFQVPKSTHILILRGLEAVQACAKKIGAWKIVFPQNPISSHKTIRGHATKKNEPQTNCKPHVKAVI